MTKTTKKKKPTASPTSTTKKSKSTSSKKSNEGNSKKPRQKGKSTNAPKGKSTDARPAARTPDRKQRKSPSLQLTPLTVTSKSTTESKRAVSMMSSLALKTPPKKKKKTKRKEDAVSKASLCDTIDFDDAAMIEWTCKNGLQAALEHHFDNHEDFEGLDYHDRIILLCNKFTPSDIKPAMQGILQESGKDWRTMKLQRLRSMKMLAPEFAKECVNIVNAKAELLKSGSDTVPQSVIIKKEKVDEPAS